MSKPSNMPFVGIQPYSENESDVFYGREEEVENLLQILQKNKLLTLSGDAGSGKTSLIKAGLIPRLRAGFLGQSGKDWSVAYFRPGINPLSNFAHALAQNGVMSVETKPKTTDYEYYIAKIEQSGATGIIDVYKRSEIFNKRNLLIVIDQLEDMFKFSKYFDTSVSEYDNVLMDIVYRSVSFKNTAIYFLICIETPFLTKLASYAKLQEIISKSQYTIQNLDFKVLNRILEQTFNTRNVHFEPKVVEHFSEVLNEDAGYLPNLQFLFKKLYAKFVSESAAFHCIDFADVNSFGGIENVIAEELESLYNASSTEEKNYFNLFFKTLANAESSSSVAYESVQNIASFMDVGMDVLSNLIQNIKSDLDLLIDVFEPSISGISKKGTHAIEGKNILSLKYQKLLNWERKLFWCREELANFQKYKSFAEDAIRKGTGEVDFLKTPELEMAIAWRDNPHHTKNWAQKYALNFIQTVEYIDQSEKDDIRIKKIKTDLIEREKQNERTKRKWYAIGGSVSLILALFAFYMSSKAEVARKLAEKSQNEALIQANEAREAKIEAVNNFEKANEYLSDSERNLNKANSERQRADSKNAELIKTLKEVTALQEIEVQQKQEIEQKNERLSEVVEEVTDKSNKNRILKDLIELKSEFRKLTIQLNDAYDDNDKVRINTLINESLTKQILFDSLMATPNLGTYISNENAFEINQKTLSILEGFSDYSQTSMRLAKTNNYSIRNFSIYNNELIAYAGDKGEVNFYDIIKGKKKDITIPIAQNNINDRIRKVIFDSKELLIVTTFSGKVFKVNPQTMTKEELAFAQKGSIIDFFIDNEYNKQYLVMENKVIPFDNYRISNNGFDISGIVASTYYKSHLFLVLKDKIVVFNSEGERFNLPLDTGFRPSDLKQVSNVYFSEDYLFLGLNSGKVFWFDFDLANIENQRISRVIDFFELHDSRVSCIYFDEIQKVLYTSSLDTKIIRYDFKLPKEEIKANFIELVGHEKWIWDMKTYINRDNKKMLITADEDGNLLSWYTETKDLTERIKGLLDN